jgi:uncharacterized membrane protein
VLGIRVPDSGEPLGPALIAQWPSFFAYVMSFLTIGIMWVQHHRMFTVIGRSNPTFAIINVVFLLFIAFIPFPTEILAQRVGHDIDDWRLATLLYGATTVCIAVMFNAVWAYASARDGHLLRAELKNPTQRAGARGYRWGPPLYAAMTLLAFAHPALSLAGFAGFAVYWSLPISGPTS